MIFPLSGMRKEAGVLDGPLRFAQWVRRLFRPSAVTTVKTARPRPSYPGMKKQYLDASMLVERLFNPQGAQSYEGVINATKRANEAISRRAGISTGKRIAGALTRHNADASKLPSNWLHQSGPSDVHTFKIAPVDMQPGIKEVYGYSPRAYSNQLVLGSNELDAVRKGGTPRMTLTPGGSPTSVFAKSMIKLYDPRAVAAAKAKGSQADLARKFYSTSGWADTGSVGVGRKLKSTLDNLVDFLRR